MSVPVVHAEGIGIIMQEIFNIFSFSATLCSPPFWFDHGSEVWVYWSKVVNC